MVIQGTEPSMIIKESDFPFVLQLECIRFVHTYLTVEMTVHTPVNKFAI
jgi:hypothetical protein